MDILNQFSKEIIFMTVERFSTVIKNTEAYRHFSESDSEMISEFKDFYCTLISSALAVIFLKIDMKNSERKEEIQTIYIGESADFLKKLISGEYKTYDIKTDKDFANKLKMNVDQYVCYKVHVIFSKILEELKSALFEKKGFYFWQYDEPYLNKETGEYENGELRLYNFLEKFFLAKESTDYIDFTNQQMIIDYGNFVCLNEYDTQLINIFILEINKIIE